MVVGGGRCASPGEGVGESSVGAGVSELDVGASSGGAVGQSSVGAGVGVLGGASDTGSNTSGSVEAGVGAVDVSTTDTEEWSRKWSSAIRERQTAWDLRVSKGRTWIGNLMASRTNHDRASRRDILLKARERLESSQKSAEANRRSRASDWLRAHVKLDREWAPVWDGVMSKLPVGWAEYSALLRSPPRSVEPWTPVVNGGCADVLSSTPGGLTSPTPRYRSFSAFLGGSVNDGDSDEEGDGPPGVPMVGDTVSLSRVAHEARLEPLEWEDLKGKVPECIREASPRTTNSAETAVWDVLDDIGTGSPGWTRCGATKARVAFSPSPDDARRGSDAEEPRRVFRKSSQAKAKCLRQHEAFGG